MYIHLLFPDITDPNAQVHIATTVTTVTRSVTKHRTPNVDDPDLITTTTSTSTATSSSSVDYTLTGGPDFLQRLERAERRDRREFVRAMAPENVAVGVPIVVPAAAIAVPLGAPHAAEARRPHPPALLTRHRGVLGAQNVRAQDDAQRDVRARRDSPRVTRRSVSGSEQLTVGRAGGSGGRLCARARAAFLMVWPYAIAAQVGAFAVCLAALLAASWRQDLSI